MASTTAQKGEMDITLEELADHGTRDSLWIGVHGRGTPIIFHNIMSENQC